MLLDRDGLEEQGLAGHFHIQGFQFPVAERYALRVDRKRAACVEIPGQPTPEPNFRHQAYINADQPFLLGINHHSSAQGVYPAGPTCSQKYHGARSRRARSAKESRRLRPANGLP